jgi:hypothetical protein
MYGKVACGVGTSEKPQGDSSAVVGMASQWTEAVLPGPGASQQMHAFEP